MRAAEEFVAEGWSFDGVVIDRSQKKRKYPFMHIGQCEVEEDQAGEPRKIVMSGGTTEQNDAGRMCGYRRRKESECA